MEGTHINSEIDENRKVISPLNSCLEFVLEIGWAEIGIRLNEGEKKDLDPIGYVFEKGLKSERWGQPNHPLLQFTPFLILFYSIQKKKSFFFSYTKCLFSVPKVRFEFVIPWFFSNGRELNF